MNLCGLVILKTLTLSLIQQVCNIQLWKQLLAIKNTENIYKINYNYWLKMKQETAEDGKAGLSAIRPWKSTNQGQGQSNHRNQ